MLVETARMWLQLLVLSSVGVAGHAFHFSCVISVTVCACLVLVL